MLINALRWLRSEGLTGRAEFALPWGICDVIGVSFSQARVKRRLLLGQTNPIGSPRRIDILSRIPDVATGRFVTIANLKRQVGDFVKPEQVEADLAALIASRFVVRRTQNTLQQHNGWMPLSKRIVAIELKLSRVSEALGQAKSHRHIADEVYVGLPASLAERVAHSIRRGPFEESGVGILGINEAECRVIVRAARPLIEPKSVLKTHCIERLWQTSFKDTSS